MNHLFESEHSKIVPQTWSYASSPFAILCPLASVEVATWNLLKGFWFWNLGTKLNLAKISPVGSERLRLSCNSVNSARQKALGSLQLCICIQRFVQTGRCKKSSSKYRNTNSLQCKFHSASLYQNHSPPKYSENTTVHPPPKLSQFIPPSMCTNFFFFNFAVAIR